jgi:hypothetical protein
MPRYVIVRTFEVDADEMPTVGRRSKEIAQEHFPQIVWEHSHVCVDANGVVKTFCVYEAPDEDVIRAHAFALGQHTIDAVYDVAGDVSPADFP